MTFSESLIQTRKRRGMSQEELAARVGVSRQAVSKWELGDAAPDLSRLLALADALDISLDVLCGREAAPASGPLPAEAPAKQRPCSQPCGPCWPCACCYAAARPGGCGASGMWSHRRAPRPPAPCRIS